MTKIKKAAAAVIMLALAVAAVNGCKNKINQNTADKTVISVCGLSKSENSDSIIKEFMEKYPDIQVEAADWKYNPDTFMQIAEEGELPTVFDTWFSEVNKIIDSGYSADITDNLLNYGYIDEINPVLLELVTNDDGRIYGLPINAYAQGLYINKNLFVQSGLVNEDGSVKIPDTYKDVAEFSKLIKNKTGKAGFYIPCTGRLGGWYLMNIAWSNGVEFVEKQKDGTWKASFDVPEFYSTLEWLYNLKWNDKGLPDNETDYSADINGMFFENRLAMMFGDPPRGKSEDEMVVARVPKGSKNRVSQMGGNLYMLNAEATPEQIDAVFKWLEFRGVSPEYTDLQMKLEEEKYRNNYENDDIVLPQVVFDVWVTPERIEKNKEIRKKYVNINPEDYKSYLGFEGVIIRPEVSVCCQELYEILDGVIKEIYTNPDVDIPSVVKKAAQEWQIKYLDKIK